MDTNQIRQSISKLRQWRYYLERQVEQIGEMLPACLILRYRSRGTKGFQSLKKKLPWREGIGDEGKSYAYVTYLKDGITRHRYIRKDRIEEVGKLTKNYRRYCEKMAKIRFLNGKIVGLLDEMSGIKMKGVEKHVKAEGVKEAKVGKKAYKKSRKEKN